MTDALHPDIRPSAKLIGTVGGIPFYADEACPEGNVYLLNAPIEKVRVIDKTAYAVAVIDGVITRRP